MRTNNFYPTIKGFVVGSRPHKGWQEGVVDVDYMVGMSLAKLVRQDLHIPAYSHKCLPHRYVVKPQGHDAGLRMLRKPSAAIELHPLM